MILVTGASGNIGDEVRAAFPDVAAAVVDPADIAAVAAAVLADGGHDGGALRLTGPEALRPAERVRILGEVLGREPRTFRDWAVAHAGEFTPGS
jgi:uncharacterized protein YbjT (DUF2867 family)